MGQLIPNSSFFISKCFMTLMTMTLMTTKRGEGGLSFVDIEGSTFGKGLAISLVERWQIHLAHPDAQRYRHERLQETTQRSGAKSRRRKRLHAAYLCLVAHLPDEIVIRLRKPALQDPADAVTPVRLGQACARLLQLRPEPLEAGGVVLDPYHGFSVEVGDAYSFSNLPS